MNLTFALKAQDFALGVVASFVAAILFSLVLYSLYVRSASKLKRSRTFARDLWWLPVWRCWRFALRNMEGEANLWEINFRSWLREIAPGQTGSSVQSFRDNEMTAGERIILPAHQDLPILCFRLEQRDNNLILVHTDKFGEVLRESPIMEQSKWELKAEYSLRASSRAMGFTFTHDVHRLLTIPEKSKTRGGDINIFRHLLSLQGDDEISAAVVFTGAEQISVKLPE